MTERRRIQVDYLARVEGEGALDVVIDGERVSNVSLRIFEPPRFFEGFLRGRDFREAPDITARICGICPVAYQMSAVHALEQLCGVTVDGPLRTLRRLLYCGEWIESHTLHVYMLHAPDFLGRHSVVELAQDAPQMVERGLRLKKAGNAIVALLGGREVHPINVRVGGFWKIPAPAEFRALGETLRAAREDALATVEWVAGFDFPDFERDYELVSLRHADEYPFNEGRIVSNRGLDIDQRDYHAHFEEHHVEHSTALHCRLRERGHYHVGPLARFALNFDRLRPAAREAATRAGIGATVRNPFKSIIVRAVEVVQAIDEAIAIIDGLELPPAPAVDVTPRAGTGLAATEAPRGLLHHTYRIDAAGLIEHAQIVPPTSQNQASIEDDLAAFIAPRVALADDALRWQCEQAVRNYDPCISCSTHFLQLSVERR
ncbi:MAG: nickel-dependent hydrogenase large subunit [Gammaproteobacteria bacterium]|nr:nickel-dependent hydrogenase large subunit [Gammaproteobacteria bacterium]MCP5198942.1 nickel-dependent hydrogenase large subunit [Gammaproteobacteria bacterium]